MDSSDQNTRPGGEHAAGRRRTGATGRGDRGRRGLGRRGENVAADYLTGSGWQILARNWRCRYGEIDLIARGGQGPGVLIFCEVKTRTDLGYGAPLEAITVAKMRRLRRLAGCWLTETGQQAVRIRVDAIGVLLLGDAEPQITHIRGAEE